MGAATMQPRANASGELDELTLARAQRGDEAARRTLIVKYQARVFAVIWRMLASRGRETIAEDLCQETFIRVLSNLSSFVPAGPARLSTWILTIATRLTLNELTRHPVSEPLDEQMKDRAPGPEKHLERRAVAEAVRRAIACLNPEQRAVVILREYHELDYEEIARILELEVGTVKSRLARARKALREALHEERPRA